MELDTLDLECGAMLSVVLLGHPSRNMEDTYAESDLNCSSLSQGI